MNNLIAKTCSTPVGLVVGTGIWFLTFGWMANDLKNQEIRLIKESYTQKILELENKLKKLEQQN